MKIWNFKKLYLISQYLMVNWYPSLIHDFVFNNTIVKNVFFNETDFEDSIITINTYILIW